MIAKSDSDVTERGPTSQEQASGLKKQQQLLHK